MATTHKAADVMSFGPMSDVPAPFKSAIIKKMGGGLVPIATLGPTEIISDNLLGATAPTARWCLQPMGEVEVLVLPRRCALVPSPRAEPAVGVAQRMLAPTPSLLRCSRVRALVEARQAGRPFGTRLPKQDCMRG